MNKTKRPFRFRIGMRNIKTAIAATLCAIGYLTANVIFDTSFDPTFACIGAIFGTGSDMGDSWLNGGNRLFGTIIGGVIGMLMFRLYLFWQPGGEWSFKILPFMFVGVVALIIACQFFRWPGGIQPGGVFLDGPGCMDGVEILAQGGISHHANSGEHQSEDGQKSDLGFHGTTSKYGDGRTHPRNQLTCASFRQAGRGLRCPAFLHHPG